MALSQRVRRRGKWALAGCLVMGLVAAGAMIWIADDGSDGASPNTKVSVTATPPNSEPPDPTPSAQASEGRCTLSRTLVPTCGAWWGSSRAPGGVADMLALQEVLQRPVPIAHFFHRDGRTFPDTDEQSFTRQQKPPALLFGNVKPAWVAPGEFISWADVADGGADAYIDEIAASIIAFDQPVFLAIHHEPEDDVIATAGSGFTADDYVAMYQHVVDRVDATIAREGSPSTGYPIWVWDVTGYPRWESLWPQLYPGDRYVDWVGYNPYVQEPAGCDFSCVANRTYDNFPSWPGFYDWAVEQFPGKPLMLGEWGVRESTLGGEERAKAEVLLSAPELLATRFPQLKALIYFNDGKALTDPTSSRIETSEASLNAFRKMVDDPYLRQTRLSQRGTP